MAKVPLKPQVSSSQVVKGAKTNVPIPAPATAIPVASACLLTKQKPIPTIAKMEFGLISRLLLFRYTLDSLSISKLPGLKTRPNATPHIRPSVTNSHSNETRTKQEINSPTKPIRPPSIIVKRNPKRLLNTEAKGPDD